eukprot:2490453-Rhodomonas_salina.1
MAALRLALLQVWQSDKAWTIMISRQGMAVPGHQASTWYHNNDALGWCCRSAATEQLLRQAQAASVSDSLAHWQPPSHSGPGQPNLTRSPSRLGARSLQVSPQALCTRVCFMACGSGSP